MDNFCPFLNSKEYIDYNFEFTFLIRSGGFGLLSQEALTKPLSVYLPIGTEVTFAHRQLPSTESQLCYQAFAVWLSKFNADISGGIGSIFDEYYEIYSEPQCKSDLIKALDRHHNAFKKHARLFDASPNLMPIILNGLPKNWQAEIVYTDNRNNNGLGIIKINHKEGADMSSGMKLNVKKMYALFSFSDVYMRDGNLCAINLSPLIRKGISVNLIARSVDVEQTAMSIFRKLSSIALTNKDDRKYISLQAIAVTIDTNKTLPKYVPKPVTLKSRRVSFNTGQTGTSYYLNPSRQDVLKSKIYHSMKLLDRGRFLDLNGIKCFLRKDELVRHFMDGEERLKYHEELDNNNTRDLIYGKFKQHVEVSSNNLPPFLKKVACQVTYIANSYAYQPEEGIVNILVKGQNVQAYFNYKALYTYNTNVYQPNRLDETVPIFQNKSLKCFATLLRSKSCVPYICTAIYSSLANPPSNGGKFDFKQVAGYNAFLQKMCPIDRYMLTQPNSSLEGPQAADVTNTESIAAEDEPSTSSEMEPIFGKAIPENVVSEELSHSVFERGIIPRSLDKPKISLRKTQDDLFETTMSNVLSSVSADSKEEKEDIFGKSIPNFYKPENHGDEKIFDKSSEDPPIFGRIIPKLTDYKEQNVMDIVDEKTQNKNMVFGKPVPKETFVDKKEDVEMVEDPIFGSRAIVDEITVSDDDIEVVSVVKDEVRPTLNPRRKHSSDGRGGTESSAKVAFVCPLEVNAYPSPEHVQEEYQIKIENETEMQQAAFDKDSSVNTGLVWEPAKEKKRRKRLTSLESEEKKDRKKSRKKSAEPEPIENHGKFAFTLDPARRQKRKSTETSESWPTKGNIINTGISVDTSKPAELYNPEDALADDNTESVIGLTELNDLSSIHNLDDFETAIQTKKVAKRNELQQLKKKLRWNKVTLQEEMKKIGCKDGGYHCITCKTAMNKVVAEKHLKQDAHWRNVYDNFVSEYDKIKPNVYVKETKGTTLNFGIKKKSKSKLMLIEEDIDNAKNSTVASNSTTADGAQVKKVEQSVCDDIPSYDPHESSAQVDNTWYEIPKPQGTAKCPTYPTAEYNTQQNSTGVDNSWYEVPQQQSTGNCQYSEYYQQWNSTNAFYSGNNQGSYDASYTGYNAAQQWVPDPGNWQQNPADVNEAKNDVSVNLEPSAPGEVSLDIDNPANPNMETIAATSVERVEVNETNLESAHGKEPEEHTSVVNSESDESDMAPIPENEPVMTEKPKNVVPVQIDTNLVPPEIFVSTEVKLKELDFFLGKVSLCEKVERCLNGDAQTVLACKFTSEEKSIIQIVNKANDVCTTAAALDKEMKAHRIHFTEWFCEICNNSAKRQGMEFHLKSNEHWTKEVNSVDGNRIETTLSKPETVGDAIGMISVIVNETICLVTFKQRDIVCTAVMDLSGVEVSRTRKKRVKSMYELKIGYPVRMNACHVWSEGIESWFYVSSGYVGDDADWNDALPKPVTLMSIKYDEDQGKAYESSFKYLNAMEEHIKPQLKIDIPELLVNQVATVTKVYEGLIIAEVQYNTHKYGCLMRIEEMALKGLFFDITVGTVLKISAILVDPGSNEVPFMCYDFRPAHSNKPMGKMLRTDVTEKEIQEYYDAARFLQVIIFFIMSSFFNFK